MRLTSDCAEVAIAGTVPAEAIIGMIDTTMLGVAHRSTVKQTISEFKDTVPNDARWRLRAWAKQRTSQIEEIGMSVEMEVLVCDLLEELREEPGALDLTESAAAQAALLQRACVELRFVERHAQQAVAIVLGRSSVNAPNVLAECLDWLCVHVPVDELPLQFRPKLRPRPARPKPSAGAGGGAAARCGVVGSEANSAASLGAPLDDDDDWDDGSTKPWNCERCTLENAADATVCEACEADRQVPRA